MQTLGLEFEKPRSTQSPVTDTKEYVHHSNSQRINFTPMIWGGETNSSPPETVGHEVDKSVP